MPNESAALDPRALESLLAFWRDAGVDACLDDEPNDRLERAAPALTVARAAGEAAAAAIHPAAPTSDEAVVEARRIAARATTVAELRSAIESFEGCALRFAGARQAVFARGREDATLMVIGEAPSAEDDLAGEPFTGSTGRLLDRMLAAAGFTDRAFITNTVFWRPGTTPNPSTQDCAACAPFLARAVDLVAPRAILLLGAAAAKALLARDEPIMALRGRWLEHVSPTDARSTPALATLHPAFLLTQPTAKAMAWRDLLTLAARVDPVNHGPA